MNSVRRKVYSGSRKEANVLRPAEFRCYAPHCLDMTVPSHSASPSTAARFDVDARADRDGVLDAASARDLSLFLNAVQPAAGATLQRPVAVWRDGQRHVVELQITAGIEGLLRFEFGAPRID